MNEIKENIEQINKKIAAAAQRAGRKREDILLLAVSKTIDVTRIKEAVACGLTELGENKVQEIMDKYEPMGADVNWHLIGHLQTNKVKYIIDKVKLIHSVDSLKLAQEINKRAEQKGITAQVLIEINIAGEESKYGVCVEEAEGLIEEISRLKHVLVKGLMTVAPNVEISEENRNYFRRMRQLLIDINAKKLNNVYMDILSMGMTGDYEVAIEEGATIVRVGTGIFGKRQYSSQN